MKRLPKAPFFEIGTKNYIFGDDVLRLAQAADQAAIENDIDVLMITPYTEIRRVAERTSRLIVLAPYMDTLRPGRGVADVLPEALKAAGAEGVLLNHCERPMTLKAIMATIQRADELELLTFACADSFDEMRSIAQLHPDIINPEPAELIGSGSVSDMDYVRQSIDAIKAIDPAILVEQAAGVSVVEHVYNFIYAGAEATGAASGIFNAADPLQMAKDMIATVRIAWNDLQKNRASGGEAAVLPVKSAKLKEGSHSS